MKALLHPLNGEFTICKVENLQEIDLTKPYTFVANTPDELSVVLPTPLAPVKTLAREDGWKGFYLDGILDFSLIGILSGISSLLAENKIGLFAVSTYNTDYIFVKKEHFETALSLLKENGYQV